MKRKPRKSTIQGANDATVDDRSRGPFVTRLLETLRAGGFRIRTVYANKWDDREWDIQVDAGEDGERIKVTGYDLERSPGERHHLHPADADRFYEIYSFTSKERAFFLSRDALLDHLRSCGGRTA